MTCPSRSVTSRLLLALPAMFAPGLALAWSPEPPQAPVTVETAETATVEIGATGAGARITMTSRDFREIAARVEVDAGDGGHARLYVYDAGGLLIEAIDARALPDGPVWTATGAGNTITVRLMSFGATRAGLSVTALAGDPGGGRPDGIPDGIPQFELVAAASTGFWAASAPAVARLIVGKNDLPLEARQPTRSLDWCTGFLVTQDLLMTAAHCLSGRPILCEQTIALFGYVRKASGPLARACVEVAYKNKLVDVAVLRLSPATVPQQVIALPATGPDGTALAVIQHPRGAVQQVSQKNCAIIDARTFSLPYDGTVDESLLDGVGFTHSCDTTEGSSGSPVLAPNGLAGVHQGSADSRNFAIRALSIARCIAIDSALQTVTVLRPAEPLCMNEV